MHPDKSANVPRRPKKTTKPAPATNGVSKQPLTVDDDDDLIIPEIQPPNKRAREDNGEEPAAKKAKVAHGPEASITTNGSFGKANDTVVIADGPLDGSIVVDD